MFAAGTGAVLHELRGHREEICCVAVSADGRTIASGDWHGALKLWHAATGQFLCDVAWDVPSDGKPCPFCAFSPDGRWLAVSAREMDVLQLLPLRQ